MPSIVKDNVSYRLVEQLSNMVICSRCLQRGLIKPVPQLISRHHTLNNECSDCRKRHAQGKPQPDKVLWMPGTPR